MRRARIGWTGVLAVAALVLGALAVFGDPYRGSVVTLDSRELAGIVQAEVDHVTVRELADWIVQARTDYRLLDLRPEDAFARYHIPTAEHVPIAELPDHPLLRNEKIVLYSDGGIHSAQGWFLLKAQGFAGAYLLLGGLDAWKEEVLYPALPESAGARELAEFERARTVSRHFGGSPRDAAPAAGSPDPASLPEVLPPSAPSAPLVRRKKKKKEGC